MKEDMIKFNSQLRSYLDNEAIKVLELITEIKPSKSDSKTYQGSLLDEPVVDLTQFTKDRPMSKSTLSFTGEKLDWEYCLGTNCFGLNEVNFSKFLRLIDQVFKDKHTAELISKSFLINKSLDWFAKEYKKNENQSNYTEYLEQILNESIKDYTLAFPISYINTGIKLQLGHTYIDWIEKKELDELDTERVNGQLEGNSNIDYLREKFSGAVIIKYSTTAELEKAQQICFEECSLAVDVLKACSLTTDLPEHEIDFDIDSRTKKGFLSHIIYYEEGNKKDLGVTISRNPKQFSITPQNFNFMRNNFLGNFGEFLKRRKQIDSELNKLIENSIKLYANAVSNNKLHNRIVELFTILESLLVKNENSSLLESILKYLPLIITVNIDERKRVTKVLKDLYKIRSARIHHAKDKKFEMHELAFLQKSCIKLLVDLIELTPKYSTKDQLLESLDERLFNA